MGLRYSSWKIGADDVRGAWALGRVGARGSPFSFFRVHRNREEEVDGRKAGAFRSFLTCSVNSPSPAKRDALPSGKRIVGFPQCPLHHLRTQLFRGVLGLPGGAVRTHVCSRPTQSQSGGGAQKKSSIFHLIYFPHSPPCAAPQSGEGVRHHVEGRQQVQIKSYETPQYH